MMMRSSLCWVPRLLILSVLGGRRCSHAEQFLKQVHVVTRHGSGYFFDDGNPAGNSVLTEYGQEQVYELGIWLRDKYQNNVLASFDPVKVQLYSSDADRAIVTAQIIAQAVFENSNSTPPGQVGIPAGAQVPVFMTDSINDVTIRAYDKCPKGIDLEKLYRSTEWANLQNDHMQLLQDLALKPEFQDYRSSGGEDDGNGDEHGDIIPLNQIFNVFDAIFVAKQWCDHANATIDPATNASQSCPGPVSEMTKLLSNSDWTELKNLAHAVETTKYDADTAGRYAGGNLWRLILERAKGVTAAKDNSDAFYLYSGHYATVLGMFAALGQDLPDDEAIPNYATAFIVEVYYDDSAENTQLKVLYKPGGSNSTSTVKIVKCGSDTTCSRSTLYDLFSDLTLSKWCKQCGNDDANVCVQYRLDQAKSDLSKANDKCNATAGTAADAAAASPSSSGASPGAVAGGVVIGIVVGALLAGIAWYFCSRGGGSSSSSSNGDKTLDLERSESPTNNTISPTGSEDPSDLHEIPITGGPYVYA